MYFHEIAVYRVPISIKKIKTFLKKLVIFSKKFLLLFEKLLIFFKNVLIFGGFIWFTLTYIRTNPYIHMRSFMYTYVHKHTSWHSIKHNQATLPIFLQVNQSSYSVIGILYDHIYWKNSFIQYHFADTIIKRLNQIYLEFQPFYSSIQHWEIGLHDHSCIKKGNLIMKLPNL